MNDEILKVGKATYKAFLDHGKTGRDALSVYLYCQYANFEQNRPGKILGLSNRRVKRANTLLRELARGAAV